LYVVVVVIVVAASAATIAFAVPVTFAVAVAIAVVVIIVIIEFDCLAVSVVVIIVIIPHLVDCCILWLSSFHSARRVVDESHRCNHQRTRSCRRQPSTCTCKTLRNQYDPPPNSAAIPDSSAIPDSAAIRTIIAFAVPVTFAGHLHYGHLRHPRRNCPDCRRHCRHPHHQQP
jgi:hypothetical protein